MDQRLKNYTDIVGVVGFAARVKDVYESDEDMNALSIKVRQKISNSYYENTGLYFLGREVVQKAKISNCLMLEY
jgi:hypothetical protein